MSFIYTLSDQPGSVTGFTHYGEKQTQNADEIYNLCIGSMTLEALCGILGNMQAESYLNPGQGELYRGMSPQYGLGLIQWTPSGHQGSNPLQDYATSVGGLWYDGNIQIQKILTGEPGAWIPKQQWPYTWAEYCQLTDYALATRAYFEERERGTWGENRVSYAYHWFDHFNGSPPPGPTPPGPGPDPGSILLYGAVREVLRRLIIHA